MDESYSAKIKDVFENKDFTYKSDIAFGELKEIHSEYLDREYTDFGPVYGVDLRELNLIKITI